MISYAFSVGWKLSQKTYFRSSGHVGAVSWLHRSDTSKSPVPQHPLVETSKPATPHHHSESGRGGGQGQGNKRGMHRTVFAGVRDHVLQDVVDIHVADSLARQLLLEQHYLLLQPGVVQLRRVVASGVAVPGQAAGEGPLRGHAPDRRHPQDRDPPGPLLVQLLDNRQAHA